ncbi:MAG: peptidase [Thermoplasmata archaeon]|jgi:Zn-dependent protease
MNPGSSYAYTYAPTTARSVYAQPAVGRVSTSPHELRDLAIAFVVLTLDLTIVLSGGGLTLLGSGDVGVVLEVVLVAAAAALTGFVAHEMAHKISAQRRGFWAEFRMSPAWLLFSIVTAFFGFLFAAPGATVIGGMGNRDDWGRTALAGPVINMVFSIAFYAGAVAAIYVAPAAAFWLIFLAFINGWFATFNLIPFGPLDGRKVLTWNSGVWAIALVIAGALAALSGLALYYGFLPFGG